MQPSTCFTAALSLFLVAFPGTSAPAQKALLLTSGPQSTLHSPHVRPEVLTGKAKQIGALPSMQRMELSLVLPLRNENQLKKTLADLYDPSSPGYRRFLTVQQFTEQFGPTEEEYQAVIDFANANGFKIAGRTANRLVVPITGTVDQVQRAFRVLMKTYQHPTEDRTFFSPDREPSLPSNLRIAHISGLNNFSLPQPMSQRPRASAAVNHLVLGSGPGGSYLPRDMRAAYYGSGSLTGQGQVVALLQFDGYDVNDVARAFSGTATVAPSGSDYVLNYTPAAGQTYSVPIHNVLLDGATGAPGQFYSPADDGEQALDIAQTIGMAPGLSQVRVYIGQSDVDMLNAMASENIAKQISISWAWSPDDPSAVDPFFQEFAAQGQSVFVASGDSGAYSPASPFYFPAEDAWVTAVGGTSLVTSGAAGPMVSETAWGRSGGGISPDGIPMPSWQAGLSTSSNGGSSTLRNVPDVAMEADFDNFNCSMGSCSGGWAGTSFASPRWAGLLALANQQAQASGNPAAGFINPWLYDIAQSSSYGSLFHDVSSGTNAYETGYEFYALSGYDLVTGWGSPVGQNLIDTLSPPVAPGFQLTTSASSLTINPGTTATTTIGVNYQGGFSGPVTLAVTSPLPAGVTASFATSPTTNTSVLTITANMLAVAQSYVVTVTGVSGSLSATSYLTICTPFNAVEITSPAPPAVPVTATLLKPGTPVPVLGSIAGVPQAIHVEWSRGVNPLSGWSSQGITVNTGSNLSVANAAIAAWDTSSISAADFYTIRVSALYAGCTVSATTLVYLEPALLSANWPRWLDITPDNFSGIVPVDKHDGTTGLAIVEPQYINMTSQPRYRVFSADGSSDNSTNLNFGTYLNPAFGQLTAGADGTAVVPDSQNMWMLPQDGISTPLPLSGANVQFQTTQVVLDDLNSNSTLSTLAYGIQNWNGLAFIFAWGADKQPVNPNFPIQVPYQDASAMWDWNQGVAVGDIDGDGNQEIIALQTLTGPAFTLGLFAADGTPRSWTPATIAGRAGQMMLVDFDGDGRLELAIAVLPQNGAPWMLHVLQSDGSERPGWPRSLAVEPPFLAAGDFGRIGHEQIIASSFDQVFVLNGDGTSLSPAWPKTTNTFSPFGPPVLADIDGDGYPELLVANGNYSFPQSSGTVSTVPARVALTSPSPNSPATQPAVYPAQVQTAAAANATSAYFAPVLQAFHPDGTVAKSWNLMGMHGEQPFYWPRLTVGDFNHDGLTDIAIVNGLISGGSTSGWIDEGTIEVISTGTPFNPSANVWPMMYHDPHNSSSISTRVARPTVNVPPGTYSTAQTVTISDATPGATIFYTTDGATPTPSSNVYNGPINLATSQTVQAIAIAAGYSQSAVMSAAYTIVPPTSAPSFSLAAGTYTSAQTVAIFDSTPGATIFYTTDGTTPSTSSIVYNGPITVSTSQTIQAMATAAGCSQSSVASAAYTINPPAAMPNFSPASGTYTSAQTVTLSDVTPGAAIYYTLDGSSPSANSTVYSAPVTVSASRTMKAIAVAPAHSPSQTASATYTITLPAAAPLFSPGSGTFLTPQQVVITDPTPGAAIHYTADGSKPTSASPTYSGPLNVSTTKTLNAIAIASGYTASTISTATFTITPPTATPTFSPAGGTFKGSARVAISDSTPGAAIYYTTDGTTPTKSSAIYRGQISISQSATIKAIAFASGYSSGAVATATYTKQK